MWAISNCLVSAFEFNAHIRYIYIYIIIGSWLLGEISVLRDKGLDSFSHFL